MDKIKCEVIQDLLPLYVEHMSSEATKALVEEHLASCTSCKTQAEAMGHTLPIINDTDTSRLEHLRCRLLRKNATTIGISLLVIVLIFSLVMVHLMSPIMVPYEDIENSLTVDKDSNGVITISFIDNGTYSRCDISPGEDGNLEAMISCITSRWAQLFSNSEDASKFPAVYTFDETSKDYPEDKQIHRIYYDSDKNRNYVCLYNKDTSTSESGGYVSLPRLTLNYYISIAALLSVVGIVCCILLRKKRKFIFMLKITLFPFAYLLSSIFILAGKGPIFDAQYYFTGTLIVTVILYVIGYWVIRYYSYKKEVKSAPPA